MPYRVSYIFQFATDPLLPAFASPHAGGWSEGHWLNATPVVGGPGLDLWAQLRSACLPPEVDIVGYRVAQFTIDGNKLIPGGVSTFKKRWPGNAHYDFIDMPQAGLQIGAAVTPQPAATRFVMRGIPDNQIKHGEYQPTTDYRDSIALFLAELVRGSTNPWGTIVRDKVANPSARVMSITPLAGPAIGSTIVLNATIGAAVNKFVRLRRVRDDNGNPVSGAFVVDTVAGGGTILTVRGIPSNITVSKANGLAYIESLTFAKYSACAVSRAVVKKVGSPPEKYRGRRSKRRA